MQADVAVIGAGIAGASLAAELAADHKVLLLEQESQPGYHTTGRSAALYSKTYGPAAIRALARASEAFFRNPPEGFAAHPLLTPRGVLLIARPDQERQAAETMAELAGTQVTRIGREQALALCPLLRADYLADAVWDPDCHDIDVHGLHQGYLRLMKTRGGSLIGNAEVRGLARRDGAWRLETKAGEVSAGILVNAAGAWADEIGALAGAEPIGLVPKRRTAMIVAAPEGCDPSPFPLAACIEEEFYLKPDAGKLLISPADETPSPPCDAQPEELDIAICVDRIERAFDLSIRQIERRWAGLRSFVADKSPVAGWDASCEGFFWLAGQGGYGIQSSPGLAESAAALIRGEGLPEAVAAEGLTADDLAPQRLRAQA